MALVFTSQARRTEIAGIEIRSPLIAKNEWTFYFLISDLS